MCYSLCGIIIELVIYAGQEQNNFASGLGLGKLIEAFNILWTPCTYHYVGIGISAASLIVAIYIAIGIVGIICAAAKKNNRSKYNYYSVTTGDAI